MSLIAGDWQELADIADLIVDPAATVNFAPPYSELFQSNVAGSAELIRLAIAAKPKSYVHGLVSS